MHFIKNKSIFVVILLILLSTAILINYLIKITMNNKPVVVNSLKNPSIIRCAFIGGGDYEKLYSEIYKFEKLNNIKVEITFKSNHFELDKKLRMDFEAGTVAYDIISNHSSYFTQYIPYLEPLDKYFTPADLNGFLPRLLDSGKKDGYLWEIPRHADISCVYYRTDLFDDPILKNEFRKKYNKDLKVPENWVDFVEVAKFFTKGESLHGTVFAGKEEALTGRFYEILTSLGGKFISANGKSDFNSEKGVEAVSILKELYVSNSMPKDMINYLWDDVAHNFVDGRIAFYLDYYNWYTSFQDKTQSKVSGKFSVARQPAGPTGIHGGWGGVHAFSITKASTKKESAAALIKFLTSPESQYKEAQSGYLPVRSSVWDKVIKEANSTKDPLAKSRLELARLQLSEDFITPPLIAEWIPASNLLFPKIQSVMLGEIDAKEALDDAAIEIDKLFIKTRSK